MSGPLVSLLKIGGFSRLARVTIKTLRFYDHAGLFRPACVDPRSGYRMYCITQLPKLARIRFLRDLGCSVSEIRELIALPPGSPAYVQRLSKMRRRLSIRVALAEAQLKHADVLLRECRQTPVSPENWPTSERRIPSTVVYTIRDCVRSNGSDIYRMFESAERHVARHGARISRSPFMLLHDMEYHRPQIDVEVCVPVSTHAIGMDRVRVIEEVTRAECVRFAGEYDQAPVLFDAALDRMLQDGKRIAGPIREVYLRFGADQRGYELPRRWIASAATDLRTELQIPFTNA